VDGKRITRVQVTPRSRIMFGSVAALISHRNRSSTRPFFIDSTELEPTG
jgi:hypothetical protein